MSKPPKVPFVKSSDEALEFEVVRLADLFARRKEIVPPLDQPHRVEFHNLIFFTGASGTHQVDFQPYAYTAGSVCLIRQGQVHAFEPGASPEGIMLLFTEAFIAKNMTQSDALSLHRFYGYDSQSPVVAPPTEVRQSLESLAGEITAEYGRGEGFGREEALRLLLKLFLLKIERVRRTSLPAGETLARLRAFAEFRALLGAHLKETRNAQDYAQLLKVTYRQLNQLCKGVTGQTAKAFIDETVILEAKRRLATSGIAIKELSFDLGFDDPTNFTQFFKKHTGVLPARFRQVGGG